MRKLSNGAWPVRLRYGQDRSVRLQLPAHLSAPQAEARAERLSELAKLLWRVPEGNARRILTAAVEADAEVFAKIEAIACEEAAKHAPRPKQQATFKEVGEAWTSGKLAREYPDHVKAKRSVESDEIRLTRLYATIGDVPIRDFTKAHAKQAMAALPEGLRSATRRQYGQVICRILKMAVWPLELIEASPIPPGFLPRVDRRSRPPLYPAEDAKLLQCGDVPLNRRLLYGLLAREGLRLGEALELRWRDLDLAIGAIRLDRTKNGARSWALRPDVVAALKAQQGTSDAYLFPGISAAGAAKQFRKHLTAAKVDRSELMVATSERTKVCIHSLRATFVTVSLANGATETFVADRTGHKSSDMINEYRQPARRFAELNLGALGSLDQLLGCATPRATAPTPALALVEETTVISDGLDWFRCRDSNSDSGIQSPLSYP